MGLSKTWADSLDIIALQTVKILPGIKPMGLSDLTFHSLDIIAL